MPMRLNIKNFIRVYYTYKMKQKPYLWYHLRLTFKTDEELMKAAEELSKKMLGISSQYLAVKELSEKEKPHIHMNFISNLSESKLRSFLIPSGLGRMDKYLKDIPEEEIFETDCYICKGELLDLEKFLQNVLFKSKIKYINEKIEEFHKKYWEVYSKIKSSKKLKNCTFIDLVVNDIKNEKSYADKVWKSSELTHRRIVLGYILDKMGKKGKGFDSIILKRLMNGVLNILDPNGMKAYMESLIFDYQEREMLGMDV